MFLHLTVMRAAPYFCSQGVLAYVGLRNARQISLTVGGLPYISTPTRYSLPAKIVRPQIVTIDAPIEIAICHQGTLDVEMRVNINIGLTSGIIEPHLTSGMSGCCSAKMARMYAAMSGVMKTVPYCCTSSGFESSEPMPA